ncbi:hypothetical protein VSH64_38190 [Amycolatopsis rhabdoformis]|uniref:Uncharacterized protein n=1 Tax=Amycolatopsis rhabdoformis TaxID=1448059 RepID=A0ABZ1I4D1_9PSEU|nr:hypothetical protein [Amycolatopsis rhabdoformis]WSE28616.1 hypothetical protein VSH64_38190 [Amycolatopsis rhabdoformis]
MTSSTAMISSGSTINVCTLAFTRQQPADHGHRGAGPQPPAPEQQQAADGEKEAEEGGALAERRGEVAEERRVGHHQQQAGGHGEAHARAVRQAGHHQRQRGREQHAREHPERHQAQLRPRAERHRQPGEPALAQLVRRVAAAWGGVVDQVDVLFRFAGPLDAGAAQHAEAVAVVGQGNRAGHEEAHQQNRERDAENAEPEGRRSEALSAVRHLHPGHDTYWKSGARSR